MRAFIAASASFWVGVALSVGEFKVPQPFAWLLLALGALGYVYVFVTWPPVYRRLAGARKDRPVVSILIAACVGALLGGGGFWLFKPKVQGEPAFITMMTSGDYPQGTVRFGIPWSNRFTELRLGTINPGPNAIHNFELTITPDVAVAVIAQETNLQGVEISPKAEATFQQAAVLDGKTYVNPLVLIATTGGYLVRCKELPSKRRLDLVIGLVTVNDTLKPGATPGSQLRAGGIFERDYVLKVDFKTFAHWYGHGISSGTRIEEVFGARPLAKGISVAGTYSVNGEIHEIKEDLAVRDMVEIVQEEIRKQKTKP